MGSIHKTEQICYLFSVEYIKLNSIIDYNTPNLFILQFIIKKKEFVLFEIRLTFTVLVMKKTEWLLNSCINQAILF